MASPTAYNKIALRFQHRRDILKQACQIYNRTDMFHPIKTRKVILYAHWPVLDVRLQYCPIQKVGSTTWRRIINQVRKHNKTVGLEEKKLESNETREIKFLFVRDPYSRLLSAYVDKLFSPNTLFWNIKGKYIIQNFRASPSADSLRCGHDVTFVEYVRYVVHSEKTLQNRNGHFIPTHDHCDVCNVNYAYIGHLETFGEDMSFLFNVTQLPKSQIPNNFEMKSIRGNAGWVLDSMKKKIRMCMTMYEACLRLWKKWHIRGIISKYEPLPVTPEGAETISMDDFVQLALKALERSTNKEEKKRQKTEALREAFASIPPADKLEVQEMLTLDFALFGFDPKPEEVFPSVSGQHANSYSYFDLHMVNAESGSV